MKRPAKKHYWLGAVSFGALECGLRAKSIAQFELGYMPTAHGFLARVRLWFVLVFGGDADEASDVSSYESAGESSDVSSGEPSRESVTVERVTRISAYPRNRHKARLRRRNLPFARRADPLSHHFLRRYGYTRFRQWIYNRTLTPRIRWCFQAWNWRWAPRESFVGCGWFPDLAAKCSAPLHPD